MFKFFRTRSDGRFTARHRIATLATSALLLTGFVPTAMVVTATPAAAGIRDGSGTDIPAIQRVADDWVQTAPTEGDRVAARALIDADRSGMPDAVDFDGDGDVDQYAAADVWVSESALGAPDSFTYVLSPDGSDVWALTSAQFETHPDLARVSGFLQ